MRCNRKTFAVFVGVLLASFFWGDKSSMVQAATTTPAPTQCDITTGGSPSCSIAATNGAIIGTSASLNVTDAVCAITPGCYNAVKADPGQAAGPINVWGLCRFVDNNSTNGTSIFVPFRTQLEWQNFTQNAPTSSSYLSIPNCSTPYPATTFNVPVPPYSGSGCTATPSVTTPQLYARYYPSNNNYTIWPSTPISVSFATCHNSTSAIGAHVSWYGLNGDTNSPSWKLVANYGPDFTLSAAANTTTGNVSGNVIKVLAGTPVTLTWSTLSSSGTTTITSGNPATTVVQNGTGGGSVSATWTSNTSASGSATVTPTAATQVYTMTATGGNGMTTVASTSVAVEQPISINLAASATTINTGGSSTLSWSVTNPSAAVVTCTASGGWSGSLSSSSGSRSVSPTANTTYVVTCSDNVQSRTAEVAIIVCQSGSLDWNGTCTTETYTAGYGGQSCPTACSTAASSLAPSTCTRNPDGASVALSYCNGQAQGCAATQACAKPCKTTVTSSLTRPTITEPITVDFTMYGGGGGAAGPFSGRGGDGGTTAIVVNGNVVASASGGGGAVDNGNNNTGTSGGGGASASGSFIINPNDVMDVYVGGGGGAGADFGITGSGDGGGGSGWPGGNATGGAGGNGYGGNGAKSAYNAAGGGAGGNSSSGGAGGAGSGSGGYYGDGGAGGGGGGGYGGGGGGAGCSDIYGWEGYGNSGGNGGSTGNGGGVGASFGGSCSGGAGGGGGASGGAGGPAWGYGGSGGLVTLTYLAAQCL